MNDKLKRFEQKYELWEVIDGGEKLLSVEKKPDAVMLFLALQKKKNFKLKIVYSTVFEGSGEEIVRAIHAEKGE